MVFGLGNKVCDETVRNLLKKEGYKAKSIKSMTLGQRSEGLNSLCTAKGSHGGSGEKTTHFIVAISFNKGVIKITLRISQ